MHAQRLPAASARARPPCVACRWPVVARAVQGRRHRLVVLAHGAAPAGSTLKFAGFVGDMRKVAMKLHTKEQAPKEGGIETPKEERKPFAPTLEGYAAFLAESKVVYEAFEGIMADGRHPEFAMFQHTGLERSKALAEDLAWLKEKYGVVPPPPQPDGPGSRYAALLRREADTDAPAFICHYYNYYFAHTAGGRMIGKTCADMLLGGKELHFYEYDGDVNELLDKVRANINNLAEGWSETQKEHCLKETAAAFKYSGEVMRVMM